MNESIYNTPDSIHLKDKRVNWTNKDAIPFFLMSDGNIVIGENGKRHVDYINGIVGQSKTNKFIKKVVLQGRYWKDSNAFSFWNLGDNDDSKVNYVINELGDTSKDCFVYYKDRVYKYQVDYSRDEEGFQYLKNVSDQPKERPYLKMLDDETKEKIKAWIKSDSDYLKYWYVIGTQVNGKYVCRELNDYELLAFTCYQLWSDFLKDDSYKDFSMVDVKNYISQLTNGTSFDNLVDFFHSVVKKKLVKRGDAKYLDDNDYSSEYNDFEKKLDDLGFDDNEYKVTYYDKSDEPYSYEVFSLDRDKILKAYEVLSNSDVFICDRTFNRKFKDDKTFSGFRIRKKAKLNENKIMKNRIRLSEGQLRRVIKESVYRILAEAENYGGKFHKNGNPASEWLQSAKDMLSGKKNSSKEDALQTADVLSRYCSDEGKEVARKLRAKYNKD